MATRALIGYLNPNNTITTTYNHWDGYPENLGMGLKDHYSDESSAKDIANKGYISYMNPVDGDIEVTANNKDQRPVTIGDSDLISSLQYFKDEASNTDYAYLYIPALGEWIMSPTAVKMEIFVDTFMDELDSDVDDEGREFEEEDDIVGEGYETKWKSFMNEEVVDEHEFYFFKTLFGDKYTEDEIETYLQSDSFIEASRDEDMEMTADNVANWENEFYEYFDNVDID
jgi:hypothetical protein